MLAVPVDGPASIDRSTQPAGGVNVNCCNVLVETVIVKPSWASTPADTGSPVIVPVTVAEAADAGRATRVLIPTTAISTTTLRTVLTRNLIRFIAFAPSERLWITRMDPAWPAR